MGPKDVPNFGDLCCIFKIWDKEPEDSGYVQQIQELVGYEV